MRVLWLTKGLGRGGAERLLVNMIPYIDTGRFQVEVAYVLPWKDAFVQDIQSQGIPVHCLDGGAPYDLRWVGGFRRLVAERGIDIVHTHAPQPAAFARVVVGSRVRFIHTEHNLWSRYRPVTRLMNKATYWRNSAVVAVSGPVAAEIRPGWGPAPPIEVVHHGTDLRAIRRGPAARQEARDRLGFGPDAQVVGTVGNLTSKKDHATLIAAFAEVARENDRARLVIVGSGPLEAATRALVDDLGLGGRVSLMGSRDDVLDLLAGLDVFVLSSRFEGFPVSLVEAMATGVASVATSVGGIVELIDDGESGLVVPPGDPGALASSLAKVLGDADLRAALGAAGAERASRLDLGQAVEVTQRIYSEISGASAPARHVG